MLFRSGRGDVSIVSSAGLVIASSANPTAIGGSISAVDPNAAKEIGIVKAGKAEILDDPAADRMTVFSPIPLGRTGDTWSVVIREPRSVVMAEAAKLAQVMSENSSTDLRNQILVAIGIALAGVAAMALVGRGISSPIEIGRAHV